MSIVISYCENIPSAVILALGSKAVLYCKLNFSDSVFSTAPFVVAAAAVAVVSFGQIFLGGLTFTALSEQSLQYPETLVKSFSFFKINVTALSGQSLQYPETQKHYVPSPVPAYTRA